MKLRFSVVLAIIMLSACKGSGPGPKESFENWVKAVEKCDVTAIKAGLSKGTVEQFDVMMKQLIAFVPAEKQKDFDIYKELCKGFKPGSIKVVSEEISGETATLTITSDGQEDKAPMKREDGSWRFDFVALMNKASPPPAKPTEEQPTEPQAGSEAQ